MPGIILLSFLLISSAIMIFTPRDILNEYTGWVCGGAAVLLVVLMGISYATNWYQEVEKDALKAIDLQILALENEVSYLEQNEALTRLVSNNGIGFKTDDWDPHYVVYQEHVKGESWIFDTKQKIGKTVALVRFVEQELLPMMIGITPKVFVPSHKPKTKDLPRKLQDAWMQNHLSHLDFEQIDIFDRDTLRRKGLYAPKSLGEEAQKFVRDNQSIRQIINMNEVHFLAFNGRYAILAFQKELEFSSENFRRVNTRINRILRLKGTPVKVEEEMADEISKLKGKP